MIKITKTPIKKDFGKNMTAVQWFLEEGRKGKACVLSAPGGDFLSPKAVENALRDEREKIIAKALSVYSCNHEECLAKFKEKILN